MKSPTTRTVTGTVNEAHRPEEIGALRLTHWLGVSQGQDPGPSHFPHSATPHRGRLVSGSSRRRAALHLT
jgi:hypothetical protein